MELKDIKYIETSHSRRATEIIRRYLDYKDRIEGEPIHHSIMILQSVVLLFTRIFDKFSFKRHGLAKMEFEYRNR